MACRLGHPPGRHRVSCRPATGCCVRIAGVPRAWRQWCRSCGPHLPEPTPVAKQTHAETSEETATSKETPRATEARIVPYFLPLWHNDALIAAAVSKLLRACKFSLSGSSHSPDWLRMKTANAPVVKREAEEDWRGWPICCSARVS